MKRVKALLSILSDASFLCVLSTYLCSLSRFLSKFCKSPYATMNYLSKLKKLKDSSLAIFFFGIMLSRNE
jgi:hypothetical protein